MPVSHQAWPLPVTSIDSFSYADLSLNDALEDLASRFIFNIPEWERNSMERVGFQVESAHWYYEDFVREQNPKFPTCSLKRFFGMLWGAVPLLNEWHEMHEEAFDRFVAYKGFVPVCGAIILNEACDKVLLVKGWKNSAGWGFPKGKINQNEGTMACAVREVLEETGFNIKDYVSEENCISVSIYSQVITLYIVHPVPEDTVFETRTRKEISRIEWFNLADLPGWGRARVPGKFFLINPFMQNLKSWVSHHKRGIQLQESNQHNAQTTTTTPKKGKKGKERPTHAKPEHRISFQGTPLDFGQSRSFAFEDLSPNFSGDLLESLMSSQMAPPFRKPRPTSLQASVSSGSELSSGTKSGNQSAATSPELPRISNGSAKMRTPALTRSQTDSFQFDQVQRERTKNGGRPTPRSSISSASSASLSPVEARNEVSQKARDLLDLFAHDATRQTPLPVPRESNSHPQSNTMPSTTGHATEFISSPNSDAAAFMAAFRQSGGHEAPLTFNAPHNINLYQNIPPMGLSSPTGPGPYPGAMANSLPFGARPPVGMHTSTNQLLRMHPGGHPSLSYPVQSFPYRPSSVPLQDAMAHSQTSTPTQAIPSHSFNENPPANHSYNNAPPSGSNGARKTPASVPRNVPHAQQLLALFHESPSVS